MRMVGTTDARHFRRKFGTAAYGLGMWSTRLGMDDLATMGHGDDERVDIESLDMWVELWDVLAPTPSADAVSPRRGVGAGCANQ